MNMTKFCIVGGDMRQLYLAEYLIDMGYTVTMCGIDRGRVSGRSLKRAKGTIMPAEAAIPHSDVIVLPIPVSLDGFRISTPLAQSRTNYEIGDILDMADADAVIAGGYISDYIRSHVKERHMRLIDYNESEIFQIRNSVPTAEGALEIAMRELSSTVRDTNALVLGYGRCGRALASLLTSVGARVTVAARSERALAQAQIERCRALPLNTVKNEIAQMSVIFNTIPSPVIDEEMLDAMSDDTVLIDIASKPGGIEGDAHIPDGIRVIYATGLPGKTCPKTAGETVGIAIVSMLARAGVAV